MRNRNFKKTELIEGDGSIVFHVGKELPDEGSNFLLVSGVRKAQGRGVYCTETSDLRYAGGEGFRQKMTIIPIFCIPLSGKWRMGFNKLGKKTFHTEGRAVLMQDLRYFDCGLQDQTLRFYYSFHPVFFEEPVLDGDEGRFAQEVIEGRMTMEDALYELLEDGTEYRIKESLIRNQLLRAVQEKKIPPNDEFLKDVRTVPTEGRIWFSEEGLTRRL